MSVLYPFRPATGWPRVGLGRASESAAPPHQAGFMPADALIRAAAARARGVRPVVDEPASPLPDAQEVAATLRRQVLAADYPCVAARSAANRARTQVAVHGRLGDGPSARRACDDLQRYVAQLAPDGDPDAPMTWVSAYAAEPGLDEAGFERALWRHLQLMHEHDAPHHAWSPAHSADPAAADFAFCIGGEAFFVIGLHPAASRLARRAPWPMLVFNLHRQFDALRTAGRYERMKAVIRQRDAALQGSPNPMLDDFGTRSEARQYAGRAVSDGWRCPFKAHQGRQGNP